MSIAFIDLAKRTAAMQPQLGQALSELVASGAFVLGPHGLAAERIATSRFRRNHAVGVSSGTSALRLALQLLEISPGDEVIVPAMTFFATAEAVLSVGATLLVADVDERGLLTNKSVSAVATERTKAVISVHLFGNCCHLNTPLDVVEDAAQSVGNVTSNNTLVATSAYPTKVWGAAGESGFVLTNCESQDRTLRLWRNHGLLNNQHTSPLGYPSENNKQDELQALFLVHLNRLLDTRIATRRAICQRYEAALPAFLTSVIHDEASPISQFTVQCRHRQHLIEQLRNALIPHKIYYPSGVHKQPACEGTFHCPVADHLSQSWLSLPCHADLTENQLDHICNTLSSLDE